MIFKKNLIVFEGVYFCKVIIFVIKHYNYQHNYQNLLGLFVPVNTFIATPFIEFKNKYIDILLAKFKFFIVLLIFTFKI